MAVYSGASLNWIALDRPFGRDSCEYLQCVTGEVVQEIIVITIIVQCHLHRSALNRKVSPTIRCFSVMVVDYTRILMPQISAEL